MIEMMGNHYGLDLLAVVLMFISLWLLGNRRREGFLFGLLAALAFVAFNGLVDSLWGILGNLLLAGVNIRGWLRWELGPGSTATA